MATILSAVAGAFLFGAAPRERRIPRTVARTAFVVGGYREAGQLVSVPDCRDPPADRRGPDAAAGL
jgi:hypothetical protein